MSTFQELMNQGNHELELRKLGNEVDRHLDMALTCFTEACDSAKTDEERLQSQQMSGITCRLKRKFEDSIKFFEDAMTKAKDMSSYGDSQLKIAGIHRDVAMTYVDWGRLDLASKRLEKSRNELLFIINNGKDVTLMQRARLELGATLSFLARLQMKERHRHIARDHFRGAHELLYKKHDQYERNNLRHWLLAEPYRIRLWLRLLVLDWKIKHPK